MGKLDDVGGNEANSGSGIPLAEAYGVWLPVDYDGKVPPQMQLMDVAEGEFDCFHLESCKILKDIRNCIPLISFLY